MNISTCPNCGKSYSPGSEVCPSCGALLPLSDGRRAPGALLQCRYEVMELTHAGGMGYIYTAKDRKLFGKPCIVKQVKEPVGDKEDLRKLEGEAERMSRLSHPNVAAVFDHFVEDGYYFLVVERIEGKTLEEIYAQRKGKLGEGEGEGEGEEEVVVVGWGIAISGVVDYIHRQGIVHRDISPDNIMLTEEGNIKFIDFGTLREMKDITAKGTVGLGKFGYTPPEQWQGHPVPQSDIFALGATLYYLLGGDLPLSKEYRSGLGPMKADYNPVFPPIREKNPEISPGLEAVLQKALQQQADDRYASVLEMRQVLRTLTRTEAAALPVRDMAQAAIPSVKPAATAPAKKSRSRAWIVALAGGIFLTGLAIVAAVIFVNDQLQILVTSVESKATPPAVAPIVNLPVVPKVADWPLPGRDAAFTRYTQDAPPDVLNVLWQTKAVGMSGELVAGEGKIILSRTTKDVKVKEVVCFDAANGKILWQNRCMDGVAVPINRAAVRDGLVFFNGGDNVYCFDGAKGDTLWRQPVKSQSPLLPLEGQVLLGSNEGVLCLDAATGQTIWQLRAGELGSVYNHLIIDKRNLIFSYYNVVSCADLDTRKINWTYDEWDGKYGSLSALTGGGGKAYVLYSDAKPGVLVCLDSSSGEKLWQVEVDAQRNEWSCAPALAAGKLVLQGSYSLSCYDAGTGKQLWFQQISKITDFDGYCNYSPPIVAGSTVISGIMKNDDCVTAYRDLETGNVIRQMDQYFILPIVAYGKIYEFDSQSLSMRCYGE